MTAVIPEPADRTIVVWFDQYDEPCAAYHRSDLNGEVIDGEPYRWFNVSVSSGDDPFTWVELLAEMKGHRGPSELISNGRIEGAA